MMMLFCCLYVAWAPGFWSSCLKPSQMHCSVNDKCVQHVQQMCSKNNDEESCEEEMDTSEPNWHWFYLAECGVWHMFEVSVIFCCCCCFAFKLVSCVSGVHSFGRRVTTETLQNHCGRETYTSLADACLWAKHLDILCMFSLFDICTLLCSLQIDPSAGCSVTSEQIEANYNRNQHGSMDFYTPKYSYRLDFSGGILN